METIEVSSKYLRGGEMTSRTRPDIVGDKRHDDDDDHHDDRGDRREDDDGASDVVNLPALRLGPDRRRGRHQRTRRFPREHRRPLLHHIEQLHREQASQGLPQRVMPTRDLAARLASLWCHPIDLSTFVGGLVRASGSDRGEAERRRGDLPPAPPCQCHLPCYYYHPSPPRRPAPRHPGVLQSRTDVARMRYTLADACLRNVLAQNEAREAAFGLVVHARDIRQSFTGMPFPWCCGETFRAFTEHLGLSEGDLVTWSYLHPDPARSVACEAAGGCGTARWSPRDVVRAAERTILAHGFVGICLSDRVYLPDAESPDGRRLSATFEHVYAVFRYKGCDYVLRSIHERSPPTVWRAFSWRGELSSFLAGETPLAQFTGESIDGYDGRGPYEVALVYPSVPMPGPFRPVGPDAPGPFLSHAPPRPPSHSYRDIERFLLGGDVRDDDDDGRTGDRDGGDLSGPADAWALAGPPLGLSSSALSFSRDARHG